MEAAESSLGAASGFILSFYILLVGSKLLLAMLAGKSRSFLTGRFYLFTIRGLGLLLIIIAFFLFREGFLMLGFQS